MTYQPVIPAGGNLGWTFLSKTREAQQTAFDNSAEIRRDSGYFTENIGGVTSAADLVADRRLLQVALGAFGLDEDINNKFFIRKVLEEGTLDPDSFANKLTDKRYLALAKAFAFDLTPPNTALSDFPGDILGRYRSSQFEAAVGEQDDDLRLAISLKDDLADLADRGMSETAQWFTVMGTPPMRAVFEAALGLPAQTAGVDLDRQLTTFRDKASRAFGVTDPSAFTDPDLQDKLIRRFLLQRDLAAAGALTVRGSVAVSLLAPLVPLA